MLFKVSLQTDLDDVSEKLVVTVREHIFFNEIRLFVAQFPVKRDGQVFNLDDFPDKF